MRDTFPQCRDLYGPDGDGWIGSDADNRPDGHALRPGEYETDPGDRHGTPSSGPPDATSR